MMKTLDVQSAMLVTSLLIDDQGIPREQEGFKQVMFTCQISR